MKKLKFVFLMALFMIVVVTVATSSQANTTKENPTTASIQESNGGAEYCWTVFSSTENTQIAVMLTVMPVSNLATAILRAETTLVGQTAKAPPVKWAEANLSEENKENNQPADFKTQAGGAQQLAVCPNLVGFEVTMT